MLEALFTSCREQRKSSHNRVSDNNRGEKSIIMLTCFLDLPRLASWRAYKAAWCISSLLYLPDKKLCCLFLTENNDTVHWKNGNKTWLTFLRPFFDKIDEDIFLFSAAGIDCFKCVSVNGSNPACEDPFHNNHSSNILERPCMGGRKGRNGLFPASACIKLSGTYCKQNNFLLWHVNFSK